MDFVSLFQSIIIGGVTVTIATQLLKSHLIPVQFEAYPRLTALGASIVASVIALYNNGVTLATVGSEWQTWATVIAGTLITAAVTYNSIVKRS